MIYIIPFYFYDELLRKTKNKTKENYSSRRWNAWSCTTWLSVSGAIISLQVKLSHLYQKTSRFFTKMFWFNNLRVKNSKRMFDHLDVNLLRCLIIIDDMCGCSWMSKPRVVDVPFHQVMILHTSPQPVVSAKFHSNLPPFFLVYAESKQSLSSLAKGKHAWTGHWLLPNTISNPIK